MQDLLKRVKVPAILLAGLAAGWAGKGLPAVAWLLSPLVEIDYWLSANAAYPTLFSASVGAGIAYGVYLLVVVRRRSARLALVDLRDEGTRLRIEALNITSEDQVNPWVLKAEGWDRRVYLAIKKIDDVDAGTYRTIDHPNTPRVPLPKHYNLSHAFTYQWHDHRLVQLFGYIKKYNDGGTPAV